MKLAKRLLRLLICSFSWARLMDRLGSISRLRGASRLLLTDRDARGAPRPWWCPLVPAYRELLLKETPLKPPWPGPKPLSLLEPLLLRTELVELIRFVRLRLMVERDGGMQRWMESERRWDKNESVVSGWVYGLEKRKFAREGEITVGRKTGEGEKNVHNKMKKWIKAEDLQKTEWKTGSVRSQEK